MDVIVKLDEDLVTEMLTEFVSKRLGGLAVTLQDWGTDGNCIDVEVEAE